jgi:hypothetical protein
MEQREKMTARWGELHLKEFHRFYSSLKRVRAAKQ